jgi:hypothetical protein
MPQKFKIIETIHWNALEEHFLMAIPTSALFWRSVESTAGYTFTQCGIFSLPWHRHSYKSRFLRLIQRTSQLSDLPKVTSEVV